MHENICIFKNILYAYTIKTTFLSIFSFTLQLFSETFHVDANYVPSYELMVLLLLEDDRY